jgi:hypothetical protein
VYPPSVGFNVDAADSPRGGWALFRGDRIAIAHRDEVY